MKEELRKLIRNAYAPYSNYPVAAIVVTKDGKRFYGVNVENASYGATVCAERAAILSAVTAGYRQGDFAELYVMVASDKPAFPCFLCRQTLAEFFEPNAELTITNGDREEHYFMSDILPHPFSSEDLQ